MDAARRGEIKLLPVIVSACSHDQITAVFQAVNDPCALSMDWTTSHGALVWKRLLDEVKAVGVTIEEETRIAAEIVRLDGDLAARPEINAINEKMKRAKADPDLTGNYRENVLCFLKDSGVNSWLPG